LPEFGVRVALGAQSGDVIRLIVRDALSVALVGAAIGAVAAFESAKVLQSLLFEVSASDPVVFVLAPVVIVAVALIAALQPGRRAVAADPLMIMRAD
jgi:ABC-type antimicrobial peptide transport system permease subunit